MNLICHPNKRKKTTLHIKHRVSVNAGFLFPLATLPAWGERAVSFPVVVARGAGYGI